MRRVTHGEKQGTYNQRELDVTVEEILQNPDLATENSHIGFVTPYRKQADISSSLMPDFSYVQGMLLRNLLNSVKNLSDEELAYVNNRASLDFVVYYKQDKSCKLVVEVDGFAFHENRPEQLRRDALKDSILKKYEIPFLRLATNGSSERERFLRALEETPPTFKR